MNFVTYEPSLPIATAGRHALQGVGKGTLHVVVKDYQGSKRFVHLPAVIVPGLGRHLLSVGTSLKKSVSTAILEQIHVDLERFKVPL